MRRCQETFIGGEVGGKTLQGGRWIEMETGGNEVVHYEWEQVWHGHAIFCVTSFQDAFHQQNFVNIYIVY